MSRDGSPIIGEYVVRLRVPYDQLQRAGTTHDTDASSPHRVRMERLGFSVTQLELRIGSINVPMKSNAPVLLSTIA